MDNQIDQLSMNFGLNKVIGKVEHSKDKIDVQSVASVITKGGSVFRGLNKNDSNKQFLARSIRGGFDEFSLERLSNHEIKESYDEIESPSQPKRRHLSKNDSAGSFKEINGRLNVYLKTPYKVKAVEKQGSFKFSRPKNFKEPNLRVQTMYRKIANR